MADGRTVDRSAFSSEVIQPFVEMGWTMFIDANGPVYDHLIKEFYSLFKFDERRSWVTFALGGRVHNMSLTRFGTALNIPSQGQQFYSVGNSLKHLPPFLPKRDVIGRICTKPNDINDNIRSTDLQSPHDIRYKIIDWNIMCREGNHTEVPASVCALLWCLDAHVNVDLAYFVAKRMVGLPSNGTRGLPYGMLLSNLFLNLSLQLVNPRPITRTGLNATTVVRMGTQDSKQKAKKRKNTPIVELDSEEEEEILHYGGTHGSGGASGSGTHEEEDDTFYTKTTEEKLNELYRNQRKLAKEQSGIKKLLKDILNAVTCNRSPPRE